MPVFATTPGGIQYEVLADNYSEQFVRDANQIVLRLKCKWDDAPDFKRELLGYTEVHRGPSPPILIRTVPLLCPLTATKRAVSARLVMYGKDPNKLSDPITGGEGEEDIDGPIYYPADPDEIDDTLTGWWRTEAAVYEVVFARPPWIDTVADDVLDPAKPRELQRYIKIMKSWQAREKRQPDAGFETVEATPVTLLQVGFIPDLEIEYVFKWFQVPKDAFPKTAVEDLLLKVNNAAWYNGRFAAGTMHFKGTRGETDYYEGAGAADGLFSDPEFVFAWRKTPWNKGIKADGSVFDLRRKGVSPDKAPYGTGDFDRLFTPE